MALRTNNPVLRDKTFQNLAVASGEPMTVNGTIARTGLLLVLMLITGVWTWHRFMLAGGTLDPAAGVAAVQPFLWGGLIAGLVFALASAFKPTWSPVTAPLYALAEGTFLGGISALFEVQYHGIVLQAIMASIGVLVVMLLLYRSGVIKVTQKFRMGVFAATGGILLLYLVSWGLSAFTSVNTSILFGGGTLSILISVFVVCIAALNLVLDFDLIESWRRAGRPALHGVVLRVRVDGDVGMVVSGTAAVAWQYPSMKNLLRAAASSPDGEERNPGHRAAPPDSTAFHPGYVMFGRRK